MKLNEQAKNIRLDLPKHSIIFERILIFDHFMDWDNFKLKF